jgi:transposase-like protein
MPNPRHGLSCSQPGAENAEFVVIQTRLSRGLRRWVNHFGPMIAADLRRRRSKPHTTWHLDEVYLKIDGTNGWRLD